MFFIRLSLLSKLYLDNGTFYNLCIIDLYAANLYVANAVNKHDITST